MSGAEYLIPSQKVREFTTASAQIVFTESTDGEVVELAVNGFASGSTGSLVYIGTDDESVTLHVYTGWKKVIRGVKSIEAGTTASMYLQVSYAG
jgi:hypothetical protein